MSSWCVGARAVRSGRSILTPFGRLASEAGGVREIELHAGPVPRGDVGEGVAARRGLVGARSGSVTVSQRFGGSAKLTLLPRLHRRVRRLLARRGRFPAADAGGDPFAAQEPRYHLGTGG
jgi:hypothetical protein